MKKLTLLLTVLLMASVYGKAQLVAYFSCSGVTEKTAQKLAEGIGADLYQIEPVMAYTSADLDWTNPQSRSSVEMKDIKSRTKIVKGNVDLSQYKVIFVGYPIWWNLAPRAVNTFLESYNFDGKTVVPFATSGGSSINNSQMDLLALYPKIKITEGRLLNSITQEDIDWAKSFLK